MSDPSIALPRAHEGVQVRNGVDAFRPRVHAATAPQKMRAHGCVKKLCVQRLRMAPARSAYPTDIRTSFEGMLTPHAFLALTRTKKLPRPTPVARNVVDVLAVSKFPRSDEPADEPASSTYEVGRPGLPFHARNTVDPVTDAFSAPGAPGAPGQGLLAPVTVNLTSFEAGPMPALLMALTLTKYVPAPTPVAMKRVSVLPVEKLERSLIPGADPASIPYDVAVLPGAAFQVSVTVDPFAVDARPVGAAGIAPVGPMTVTETSFDAGLIPPALAARILT